MVWPARIIIPFDEPEPVDTLPSPNPFQRGAGGAGVGAGVGAGEDAGAGDDTRPTGAGAGAPGAPAGDSTIRQSSPAVSRRKTPSTSSGTDRKPEFTNAQPCKGIIMVNLVRAEDLVAVSKTSPLSSLPPHPTPPPDISSSRPRAFPLLSSPNPSPPQADSNGLSGTFF